jgi:hypothetical protein
MLPAWSILSLTYLLEVSRGEELAFVDVFSDDKVNIRSLDVPVAAVRGTGNFFALNPMEAQDWASVSLVNRTLMAELTYFRSSPSSIGKAWRQELHDALAPIFAALPKNEHGRLGISGVRYALHRLFTARYGWSIKGTEPAGEAWVSSMSVTPDVRQMSKYMVPTFLYQLLKPAHNDRGLDLDLLTVVAATFENLVHNEMLKNLYHVYKTLGLTTAGRQSIEVDEILETYMMVFGFGTNLELSSREDFKKARSYLESHHHGWQNLHELLKNARQAAVSKSGVRGAGLAFDDVVFATAEAQRLYGRWQSGDCSRAVEELGKQGDSGGRVRLADVKPVNLSSDRALFAETEDALQQLGVLAEGEESAAGFLISTNYIQSQAMCLSTGSYFEVCCPNVCEGYLGRLEKEFAKPTGDVETIARILTDVSGKVIGDKEKALLQDIAEDGRVVLHGRAFSKWLHGVLPSQCAAPSDKGDTNPKTADEWLAAPSRGVEATEELVGEIANFISRYTAAGGPDDIVRQNLHSKEINSFDQDVIVRTRRDEAAAPQQLEPKSSSYFWWLLRLFFYAAIALSMLKAAGSLATSWLALASTSDDIKKEQHWCAHFA